MDYVVEVVETSDVEQVNALLQQNCWKMLCVTADGGKFFYSLGRSETPLARLKRQCEEEEAQSS